MAFGLLLTLLAAFALFAGGASSAVQANVAVHLDVVSAGSPVDPAGSDHPRGEAVANFDYLIVKDDTGDVKAPDALCVKTFIGYPTSCQRPSIRSTPGGTAAVDQIVTQGDQEDFAGPNSINLPPGKYVVSVTSADGFKIDGTHFTVTSSGNVVQTIRPPGVTNPAGHVTVAMVPAPLPTATVRVQVFEDVSSVNGELDAPDEVGLSGFVGHISDVLAEVVTDVFGNPLCTKYVQVDGKDDPDQPIPGTGGRCVSDADGMITIPNLGRNRYSVQVTPPTSGPNVRPDWIQTSTLEGGHDWDVWPQENATGFDTEFILQGEPVPEVTFGFVHPINPRPTALAGTPAWSAGLDATHGRIKGQINGVRAYTPTVGGVGVGATESEGNALDPPVADAIVALGNLQAGDTTTYLAAANPDGTFDITGVPAGDYLMTVWDKNQDFLVRLDNVTVRGNQVTDTGIVALSHWFAIYRGSVFIDSNANGKRDPGENGLPNQGVTLKSRDNSVQDQGIAAVTTDANGDYSIREGYPLGQFVIEEVYNDLYYTTGVTYQTDNQPTETTVLGAGVDISLLGGVGLSTRIDWGVKRYAPGENGGIVSTVLYNETRNELDAAFAATEDYEAGISGLTTELLAPVPDYLADPPQSTDDGWARNSDGSYKGVLIGAYTTETYERPTNCVARDVDGNDVTATFPFLPSAAPGKECIDGAFALSNQVGTDSAGNVEVGENVNGNYGFGDMCVPDPVTGLSTLDEDATLANGETTCTTGDPIALLTEPDPDNTYAPVGDYLVKVVIPDDLSGKPKYNVTREEDINVFSGNEFQPQIPPPPCAGALHKVDVEDQGTDNYPAIGPDANGVTVPASTPTKNPDFLDVGGSPYEGEAKPLCDVKLITLHDRSSIASGTFSLFTKVPVPGRLRTLVTDDLTLSADPNDVNFGEKLGIPNLPVGFYDWTGRLVYTMHTDASGFAEAILPSTDTYNCPLPAGPCPGVYRLVSNDAGSPDAPNADYQPAYRTLATNFQVWPNLTLPSDLAPWPNSLFVAGAGQQTVHPAECLIPTATPQLFAVNKPYILSSASGTARNLAISGLHFATSRGSVTLTNLGSNSTTTLSSAAQLPTWNDRDIVAVVPSSLAAGAYQLAVKTATGQITIDGLTFHVLGSGYNPRVAVVRPTGFALPAGTGTPSYQTTTIQRALNYARQNTAPASTATRNGTTHNGSTIVNGLSFPFGIGLSVGMPISGANIPAGTTIAALPPATVATSRIGNRTAGNATITGISTTGLQVGMGVTGTGIIPLVTSISSVGATSITLSTPAFSGSNTPTNLSFSLLLNSLRLSNPATGPANGSTTLSFDNGKSLEWLVVVYPGTPGAFNPLGSYYENLVVNSPVKLQGVGPGGLYTDSNGDVTGKVLGSIVDGQGFSTLQDYTNSDPSAPTDGSVDYAAGWRNLVGTLTWSGNPQVYDGAVITLFAQNSGNLRFQSSWQAGIDGLRLTGGEQFTTPANLPTVGGGTVANGQDAEAAVSQGGAIYANGYAHYLRITNNLLVGNGGTYGGAIRLGTPDLGESNANDHIKILNNRVLNNGGTNLAGAIGIFRGADSYEIARNDICGNFSAEYGGGISHFGRSGVFTTGSSTNPTPTTANPVPSIHDNQIYYNGSYDEGGGIIVAGELPVNPTSLSQGSGRLNIFNNLIQHNIADDDGGGLRFLMAGNYEINVYNNMLVNNVSAHEGGGVAFDDATNVRFYNNTVAKNVTTATAATSDGRPAPAGLSDTGNSVQLQATLAAGHAPYSDPIMFDNVFWDNRAGWYDLGSTQIAGIGRPGDTNPIKLWDLGLVDGLGPLHPHRSIIQDTVHGGAICPTIVVPNSVPPGQTRLECGYVNDGGSTNKLGAGFDPSFLSTYDTEILALPWRGDPHFVGAVMIALPLRADLGGNYHLGNPSAAANVAGAANYPFGGSTGTLNAPSFDIDNQNRPNPSGSNNFDLGADER